MASTFSPNLRLELIGTGEQQGTWGATTNTNLGTLLEEAIGGYINVTVSNSGDTTLTANNGSTDQSRNMVINLVGTISATRTVLCPAVEKLYVVKNSTTGGFAVTFKVSGQTGVTIPNGSTVFIYVDGTDARSITGSIAAQSANNVAITGGTIGGVTISGITDLAIADGGTGASDATTARTNLGIGTVGTQNANAVSITGGSITGITDLAIADGGTGASDAATARTNFGLGTIATQNANTVSITGGNISGITDLTIADGGTGASDAGTARTNLGLGTISTQNSNSVTITGGSLSGLTNISTSNISVTNSAGAGRDIYFQTSGSNRFSLGLNIVAESGANAGSNFRLVRYDDSGASLGSALNINRATGVVNVDQLTIDFSPAAYDKTSAAATTTHVYNTVTTIPTNTQTGTSYTLALSDAGKLVILDNASAITLTVPTNASVAIPIYTRIEIASYGAGQVTVSPGVGVTLYSAGSRRKLTSQFSGGTLIKVNTDVWMLFGDLSS